MRQVKFLASKRVEMYGKKMNTEMRSRLYVDQPLAPGQDAVLRREQAHYLLNVMRLDPGARLLVFNGRDGEFEAEIIPEGRKQARLGILSLSRPQPQLPTLMLAFAPVKKARIDFIAEKATELGVGIIQPVVTAYTNVSRVNTGRLAANAIEAAEQTGRLTIPVIREPLSLDAFLAGLNEDFDLIFCDEGLAPGGEGAMIERVKSLTGPAAVLIGPEGGFSQAEREQINAFDRSVAVSLGPNILRADTAMVAALTLWQAAAGAWKEERAHG